MLSAGMGNLPDCSFSNNFVYRVTLKQSMTLKAFPPRNRSIHRCAPVSLKGRSEVLYSRSYSGIDEPSAVNSTLYVNRLDEQANERASGLMSEDSLSSMPTLRAPY